MIEIEQQRGLRSTVFVIPFREDPGLDPNGTPSPRARAALYDASCLAPLLRAIEKQGWEIGVHGLKGHLSSQSARSEREAIESLGVKVWGHRSHWLITSPLLYWNLIEAGYAYDSSTRVSDGCKGRDVVHVADRCLVVLPIAVQDKDVLANQNMEIAWSEIKKRLDKARAEEDTVTVLVHTNHFGPPRFWGDLYERMLDYALGQGAAICRAIDAVQDANT
ncbi:MAG: hypothetical protein HPY55_08600 [Firmicutes bacterium]|nr:hypothetical protein [Bacillota bacterium]